MITTILLSAGESTRFGSPKALASINNTTAIEHIQQKLLKSISDHVIVVLGYHHHLIQPHILTHKNIKSVYNQEYQNGQISSIQCGLRHCVPETHAILIWPVDCPLIDITTVDTIIKEHQNNSHTYIIPSFNEKRGHPPLIPKEKFSAVLNLTPDKGLNHLYEIDTPILCPVNDAGVIKSFNTQEEFLKLQS